MSTTKKRSVCTTGQADAERRRLAKSLEKRGSKLATIPDDIPGAAAMVKNWFVGALEAHDLMASAHADRLAGKGDEAREEFTVACRLDKLLVDAAHPAIIADAAERAHRATRLASRLLNFHARKCLERDLPLPRFGHEHWLYKAWNCVTRASWVSEKQQLDADLVATRDEFMPDLVPVDSTRLVDCLHFEARRWAATASTNVYQHFAQRVKKHVRAVYQLPDDRFKALTKEEKLARRLALARVAFDLCSPPTNPLKSDAEYHPFIAETRTLWRLHAFPWDGKCLKYHQKANSATTPSKSNVHLLLRAMWYMLRRRELDGGKGFSLLPLRTAFVPRHTQFGGEMLRSLLGVGSSEHRKARNAGCPSKQRKKAKRAGGKAAVVDDESDDDIGPPPPVPVPASASLGGSSASSSTAPLLSPPAVAQDESSAAASGGKRKREVRPKAVVAEERRTDLAKLFDLRKAGVHDCRGKRFECKFTSDGYAAHLQFSRPKPPEPPKGDMSFPTKGIWSIEELAARRKHQQAEARAEEARAEEDRGTQSCEGGCGGRPSSPGAPRRPPTPTPWRDGVNDLKAPKDRVEKICLCCDGALVSPVPDFICVGCDPGRNEPANLVDPLSRRKMRMTAAGRRHHTTPAKFERTNRTRKQSYRQGGVGRLARDAQREMDAIAYHKQHVAPPEHIKKLESEMGQLSCATSSDLLGFRAYVDVLKDREPALVPHYEQLIKRKLRFKAHVGRQRFESRFVRDIKRTFDPDKTGRTIVICWGSWGKIAGRPGTVGNKGLPPTIGVSLARRVAKEDGLVVAWTPEHYTTATCYECGGECKRFTEAEQRRCKDSGFVPKKGKLPEIRGLKRCSSCRRAVNRDLNAAKNIAANGLLLLTGHQPIRVHSDPEVELLQLENDMPSAEG